ncbi:MAG: hypothetical protein K6F08_01410, partial [bacterium]|nr:hypothetical protein [bacterium]
IGSSRSKNYLIDNFNETIISENLNKNQAGSLFYKLDHLANVSGSTGYKALEKIIENFSDIDSDFVSKNSPLYDLFSSNKTSLGFALAFKIVCNSLGFDCLVAKGYYYGSKVTNVSVNFVKFGNSWYAFDLFNNNLFMGQEFFEKYDLSDNFVLPELSLFSLSEWSVFVDKTYDGAKSYFRVSYDSNSAIEVMKNNVSYPTQTNTYLVALFNPGQVFSESAQLGDLENSYAYELSSVSGVENFSGYSVLPLDHSCYNSVQFYLTSTAPDLSGGRYSSKPIVLTSFYKKNTEIASQVYQNEFNGGVNNPPTIVDYNVKVNGALVSKTSANKFDKYSVSITYNKNVTLTDALPNFKVLTNYKTDLSDCVKISNISINQRVLTFDVKFSALYNQKDLVLNLIPYGNSLNFATKTCEGISFVVLGDGVSFNQKNYNQTDDFEIGFMGANLNNSFINSETSQQISEDDILIVRKNISDSALQQMANKIGISQDAVVAGAEISLYSNGEAVSVKDGSVAYFKIKIDASENQSFSAYHFDSDYNEFVNVDCVRVGDYLVVSSTDFSPFIIVKSESELKNVYVEVLSSGGGAYFTKQDKTLKIATVNKGESVLLEVSPEDNCSIDFCLLNGTPLSIVNGKVSLGYYDLAGDNKIEVSFVQNSVKELDISQSREPLISSFIANKDSFVPEGENSPKANNIVLPIILSVSAAVIIGGGVGVIVYIRKKRQIVR